MRGKKGKVGKVERNVESGMHAAQACCHLASEHGIKVR